MFLMKILGSELMTLTFRHILLVYQNNFLCLHSLFNGKMFCFICLYQIILFTMCLRQLNWEHPAQYFVNNKIIYTYIVNKIQKKVLLLTRSMKQYFIPKLLFINRFTYLHQNKFLLKVLGYLNL